MAKKGQAALEYLMTYGWAIFILVFVLGVLFASGLFNPNSFAQEYCLLPPQLPCVSHIAYTSTGGDYLVVKVENNFGYDIAITDAKATVREASANVPIASPKKIKQGETIQLVFKYPKRTLTPNKFEKFKIEITYITCATEINPKCIDSSEYKHTMYGTSVDQVQVGS